MDGRKAKQARNKPQTLPFPQASRAATRETNMKNKSQKLTVAALFLIPTVIFAALLSLSSPQPVGADYNPIAGGVTLKATDNAGVQTPHVNVDSAVVTGAVTATPAATELHLGEVGGNMSFVTAELTRVSDTNAYTAGDVVSNSTTTTTLLTFTNLARVNGGSGYIVLARATTDKKSITPRLDLQVYNASTPTVAGDNVLHAELYADVGKRIGNIVLPAMATPLGSTNSDISRAMNDTVRLPYKCASDSRNVHVLVTTLDAFTPASAEKFSITLAADNN